MIKFDEKSKVFTITSKNTTYAFGLLDGVLPANIYFGKRLLNDIPENWDEKFYARTHSPMDYGEYSSNYIPLEFAPYGGGDARIPAFEALYNDGSNVTRTEYKGYEIIDGKPGIDGLPSAYAEKGDRVQTLVLNLYDSLQNVDFYLYYSVFEDFDIITRSLKIVNGGEDLKICRALSMSVDFFGAPDSDFLHLDGTWARERAVSRNSIQWGNQNVESHQGVSSAYHSPFIALCDKDTTELSGNAYGFALVYSGSFTAGIERSPYDTLRVYMGINPLGFSWQLQNGEEFNTPEVIMSYSSKGLSGMSQLLNKIIRKRVCRGKYRDTERFALINNWEATYFDFNEDKIVQIAEKAKQIGIDTMVLDDGWFGRRTDDTRGLGDWTEMPERLPNGINGLCNRINDLGMHFGLWFEPEMVNPDSALYEAHPDWIIHTKGRTPSKIRWQYTLDLSRNDVCDYIVEAVGGILSKANIEYVKWDMNRYMSEVGSAVISDDRQGEVMHRYILGLYSVCERLMSKFPNVLFEGCASGGSRFDCGMLYYMPQFWTSDDTDAVERIKIQYGTSFCYPYSSMGAHVSACPNHQIGRTTPFGMRCDVAIPGQFGFELDLNKCTDEEIEIAAEAVKNYRKWGEIFHKGDLYRLRSPFESEMAVNEFVSEDKSKALLCIYPIGMKPSAPDEYIKLCGLKEDSLYEVDGKLYGGDYLMNKGIWHRNDREYKVRVVEITEKR